VETCPPTRCLSVGPTSFNIGDWDFVDSVSVLVRDIDEPVPPISAFHDNVMLQMPGQRQSITRRDVSRQLDPAVIVRTWRRRSD
jgi:hypothetical protein